MTGVYVSIALMIFAALNGAWAFIPVWLVIMILVADPNNIVDYGFRVWEWS
jgi:hypothetical protein